MTKTLECRKSLKEVDVPVGRCLSILRSMDPTTWSAILNEQGTENEQLLQRLDLTFYEGIDTFNLPDNSPSTSLFLRLTHPNTALRMEAAKELVETTPSETVSHGENLCWILLRVLNYRLIDWLRNRIQADTFCLIDWMIWYLLNSKDGCHFIFWANLLSPR